MYVYVPRAHSSPCLCAPVRAEEIFGPVLAILKFRDEDDVVRRANALPYGLAAAVWTRDIFRAQRVSRRLKAGTVWVRGAIMCSPLGGLASLLRHVVCGCG